MDGRLDGRLRIWLQADRVHRGPDLVEGHVVRLSLAPESPLSQAGTYLRVKARIYPPPGRVLHGAPDHSLRALAAGVVASGYVISRRPAVAMPPDRLDWRVRLAAFRQRRADEIAAAMDWPAGGIAAALLIGTGAMSNSLSMTCFVARTGASSCHSGLHGPAVGAVGFVRAAAALLPGYASRFAAHKLAACVGMVAGFAYLLLSGMSVSAVRAWLIAMLVLAAWLLDRLGLTLRNVGIAAFIVLLVSPLSLFTAGMQLSFAAGGAGDLVRRPPPCPRGRSRPCQVASQPDGGVACRRWRHDPLTAYHFGAIAPWGVLANLIGIPLTGLLIMPAGMAVLVTGALPGPRSSTTPRWQPCSSGSTPCLPLPAGSPVCRPRPGVWRRRRGHAFLSLWRDGGGTVPRHLHLSQKACPGRHRRTGAGGLALQPACRRRVTRAARASIWCWPGRRGGPTPSAGGQGVARSCHPILPTMPRACLYSLSTPMAAPPMAGPPECSFTTARPAEHSPSSRHDDG